MIRYLVTLYKALEAQGNPFYGHDDDLARTWTAVDETTRSIAFFRNLHETRACVYRRLNHVAAEGGEYRGIGE